VDVLTPLEAAVLEKALSEESPILGALREQASAALARERDLTGVGFMTSFEVPSTLARAPLGPGEFCFGDVAAQIDGLKHGAGFLIYVRDGRLDALEGYTYDEAWPEHIQAFTLDYMDLGRRDFGPLGV
jgi:hypothetical protein